MLKVQSPGDFQADSPIFLEKFLRVVVSVYQIDKGKGFILPLKAGVNVDIVYLLVILEVSSPV